MTSSKSGLDQVFVAGGVFWVFKVQLSHHQTYSYSLCLKLIVNQFGIIVLCSHENKILKALAMLFKFVFFTLLGDVLRLSLYLLQFFTLLAIRDNLIGFVMVFRGNETFKMADLRWWLSRKNDAILTSYGWHHLMLLSLYVHDNEFSVIDFLFSRERERESHLRQKRQVFVSLCSATKLPFERIIC